MRIEQRNSLRLQWMMVAFRWPFRWRCLSNIRRIFGIEYRETADREIKRALDVAHEHALKVFETIDGACREMAKIVRDVPDADIVPRERSWLLRLKQLVASLPQVKSASISDAKGHAHVEQPGHPSTGIDFSDRDYFRAHVAGDVGTYIGEALKPRPPYQGATFFGVSRRRPGENGSFTGVLQASGLRNISSCSPGSAASPAATSRSAGRTAPCWRVSRSSIATSASTAPDRSDN